MPVSTVSITGDLFAALLSESSPVEPDEINVTSTGFTWCQHEITITPAHVPTSLADHLSDQIPDEPFHPAPRNPMPVLRIRAFVIEYLTNPDAWLNDGHGVRSQAGTNIIDLLVPGQGWWRLTVTPHVSWTVEPQGPSTAFLINPSGGRVAMMSRARANGIAAALNTPEGARAFEQGRHARTHERQV